MSGPEFDRKENEARLIASKGPCDFSISFCNACGQMMPVSEGKSLNNSGIESLGHVVIPIARI